MNNPYPDGDPVVYLTRIECFSAAHRLNSPYLDEKSNELIYGKCNNLKGHGHNYKVEVTVKGKIEKDSGMVMNISDLKQLLHITVLKTLDHKHLDEDITWFKDTVSTTENVAVFIWQELSKHLKEKLHCVKVYETDKNVVKFYGEYVPHEEKVLNIF